MTVILNAHEAVWNVASTPVEWGKPFWLVVENYADLAAILTADELSFVMEELYSRLAGLCGCGVGELDVREKGARVATLLLSGIGGGYDGVLTAVGREPYRCGDKAVVLALSAQPQFSDLCEKGSALRSEGARVRWLRDMSMAVRVHDAIARNELAVLYQPIASAPSGGEVLYHDCLVRVVEGSGVLSPREFMPALERLGLTRLYDAYVLREVLEHLGDQPEACFGCNISGLSVVNDLWWQDIQQTLALNPQFAARLVLGIGPLGFQQDLVVVGAFIDIFRRFGSKIALYDYGGESGLPPIVIANVADIIKIDADKAGKVVGRPCGAEYFSALIRMSSCFARNVVVEGIDEQVQFQRARFTGVDWFQGDYIGHPTMVLRGGRGADKLAEGVVGTACEAERIMDFGGSWRVPGGVRE
jgi:EAL domain-containing protein (putative c-di-GMP-specific phosphodiesterase class I)